jgi:hypothetical protein
LLRSAIAPLHNFPNSLTPPFLRTNNPPTKLFTASPLAGVLSARGTGRGLILTPRPDTAIKALL